MIVKNGYEVYPLRRNKVVEDRKVVWEQNANHGKSYFILDLALPGTAFIPAGADGLVTADGYSFGGKGRRQNRI